MIFCCECNQIIDIEKEIYRCFDGTTCSKYCQNLRYLRIIEKDRKMSDYMSWDKTSNYLLKPNVTIQAIKISPSFVPIYIKNKDELSITASKLLLTNNIETSENIDCCNRRDNAKINSNKNFYYLNSGVIDNSCSIIYNGVNKLYNILNKII